MYSTRTTCLEGGDGRHKDERKGKSGQIFSLLKVCVIVEAGSLQTQKLYEEKKQKESERRKYVWMEYYLDSILIWIESLFLECNTPDPSTKTQKDSAEKDDYSSTKTVLHLSKKKMNS